MGRRRVVHPEPIGSRDDKRSDEKREKKRIKKKAEELHEQGMPYQMAMAVAHGRMELNEALERMARNERVDKLMAKHDLSRALATQIALGHADLDRVLYRRRREEHRETHRERSVFDGITDDGRTLVLGLHGQREVEARITDVGTYGLEIAPVDGGESDEIHKLQVKYAFEPDQRARVEAARSWDEEVRAEPREPIKRPQDRYPCSDKRLFRYVDEQVPVRATLLEGEQFVGQVAWFSRFEFELTSDGETMMTVFRHALHDLREVDGGE